MKKEHALPSLQMASTTIYSDLEFEKEHEETRTADLPDHHLVLAATALVSHSR